MLGAANGGDWMRVGDSDYAQLGRTLRKFDLHATIAAIGGLLTVPAHQAATLRLEVLAHLVTTYCDGEREPSTADVSEWLESTLANLVVRRMEDPVEDVFVSNVIAPGGNFRVFEGIWESSDRALQAVIDAFVGTEWGRRNLQMLAPVVALLRLSDAIAERAGVARWTITDQAAYPSDEFLIADIDLTVLARRVTFTMQELASLGVAPAELAPFVLPRESRELLKQESLGHTTLERSPLIAVRDGFVLALPTAVSPAARRYLVQACINNGKASEFWRALGRADFKTVEEALRLVDAPHGVGEHALPSEPTPRPLGPVIWDEIHCPIDEDKIAQVLVLHDTLEEVETTGLAGTRDDPEISASLTQHIDATARHLARNGARGLVIILIGGIGRGVAFALPALPSGWHAVLMNVANFASFAWSSEASLLRLWKLQEQIGRLEVAGTHVLETNGALNTYAYWLGNGLTVCPVDFPYPPTGPAMIQIGTDFIRSFRVTERRLNDIHAAHVDAVGTAVRVQRFARTAFFPAMLERPVYVASELLRGGKLVGLYEHRDLYVWVWAGTPKQGSSARDFLYRLWECVLSWLDRLVPALEGQFATRGSGGTVRVQHIQIELSDEARWSDLATPNDPEPASPIAVLNGPTSTVTVLIPFGFVSMLMRPTNDAERALLEVLTTAILTSLDGTVGNRSPEVVRMGGADVSDLARDVVGNAMRGSDTRFMHLFEVASPTDRISAQQRGRTADPRFVFPEDSATWEEGLAWKALDRETLLLHPTASTQSPAPAAHSLPADSESPRSGPQESRVLTGKPTCTNALNALVKVLWQGLRERLTGLNGPLLVTWALENTEAVFRDREHWRRTARALDALYGAADDVGGISANRENQRAAAAHVARVLAEMAVCTCPRDGRRTPSLGDYDYLAAGVWLLVNLASDSDAIHAGLAEPWLRIYPSGRLEADHTYMTTITNPFAIEAHTTEFHAAVAAYAELYSRRVGRQRPTSRREITKEPPLADLEPQSTPPLFDADFTHAFTAEFHIRPERVLDGLGELVDLGLAHESVVVVTTRGAVSTRLADARSFSPEETRSFFELLALVPYGNWGETPTGFEARDWYPWRFRRRLSVVARPLITFGDDDAAPLIFGMHQLGASVSYLIENIRSAWLPEEFFRSEEMSRYRGAVADAAGAAFTQETAARLQQVGWETVTEVRMPSLGAPQALGDLDVVAWRAGDERLLLIECKRLQPARTIGEIGELLKQFRGDTGDRLGKHIRRCDWVREHRHEVAQLLGIPAHATEQMPLLVTNRDVPMRFRSDLPLPSNQIVPLAKIGTVFGPETTQ